MTDKLRESAQQALEAIERACHTAMTQTLKARIPECGEFAGIAQDLDFVINALRAALAQQDAQPESPIVRQNKLLADALAACILASGIVRKDIEGLTGPQLLLFAEDLREMLATQSAQQDAQAVPQPSPTAGMNIAQRILHVGGRNNAAGYVEFGSIQAVEALVRQVIRDLPELVELENLRHNVKVYREATALMLNAAPTPPTVEQIADRIAQEEVETIAANRERLEALRAAPTPPAQCQGTNCRAADGQDHSPECIVETAEAQGWGDAPEAVAARQSLNAAPTPPAPKPLGWLDRKAVECLQGAELNWMPAWNRPTSSDPVPIFLLPPAQRVMLTDEDIREWWVSENGLEDCDMTKLDDFTKVVRAVIEAYERKNGLKP